jgi:YHS domain-containing protein
MKIMCNMLKQITENFLKHDNLKRSLDMRKISIIPVVILVAGLFAASIAVNVAEGADKAKKTKIQTTCPVLDGDIDKQLYVDYKGYRIYFCCKGCPEEFMKNPEKYMNKLRDSGVTLEKSPKG